MNDIAGLLEEGMSLTSLLQDLIEKLEDRGVDTHELLKDDPEPTPPPKD